MICIHKCMSDEPNTKETSQMRQNCEPDHPKDRGGLQLRSWLILHPVKIAAQGIRTEAMII